MSSIPATKAFLGRLPRDSHPNRVDARSREDERRAEKERRATEVIEAMEAQLRALRDIVQGDGDEEHDESVTD